MGQYRRIQATRGALVITLGLILGLTAYAYLLVNDLDAATARAVMKND